MHQNAPSSSVVAPELLLRAFTEDQLEQALQSRRVIGQAIGILMQRDGIDSDRAYARLVATSQQRNIKMRDIARQLVEELDQRHGVRR